MSSEDFIKNCWWKIEFIKIMSISKRILQLMAISNKIVINGAQIILNYFNQGHTQEFTLGRDANVIRRTDVPEGGIWGYTPLKPFENWALFFNHGIPRLYCGGDTNIIRTEVPWGGKGFHPRKIFWKLNHWKPLLIVF